MGWASGSALFSEVWKAVRKHLPKNKRVDVCKKLIEEFESEDCDTICECFGDDPVIEQAYYQLHPEAEDQ